MQFRDSVTLPTQSGTHQTLKPDVMAVAGANMQWVPFFCHCSQKREKTAFELVLQSVWGLSSHSKQVARITTRKRSQCWKWEEF